jgi:putative tricarboxylic transport membrane protein
MVDREIKSLEGVVWIAVGIVLCILALKFNLGSFREPGPGFVVFLSGLLISAAGLAMIISKTFLKSKPQTSPEAISAFQAVQWPRLTYTVGLLLGYTLFLNSLGYVPATFLLMWSMSYDWKKKNWTSSVLFSSVTVIISYLMFEIWLRCQLPRGIFQSW